MSDLLIRELEPVDMDQLGAEITESGVLLVGQVMPKGQGAGKLLVASVIGDGRDFHQYRNDNDNPVISTNPPGYSDDSDSSITLGASHFYDIGMWDTRHFVSLVAVSTSGVNAAVGTNFTSYGPGTLKWGAVVAKLDNAEGDDADERTLETSNLRNLATESPEEIGTVFGLSLQDVVGAEPKLIPIEGEDADEFADYLVRLFKQIGAGPVSAATLLYDTTVRPHPLTASVAN